MEWSTVIFLIFGMFSLVLLMGVIIFGVRKSSEMKDLEKKLEKRDQNLDSVFNKLWEALEESEVEKEKILQRLENIEAIVTSESWETAKDKEREKKVELDLDNVEPEELDDIEKEARSSKRVR